MDELKQIQSLCRVIQRQISLVMSTSKRTKRIISYNATGHVDKLIIVTA